MPLCGPQQPHMPWGCTPLASVVEETCLLACGEIPLARNSKVFKCQRVFSLLPTVSLSARTVLILEAVDPRQWPLQVDLHLSPIDHSFLLSLLLLSFLLPAPRPVQFSAELTPFSASF